MVVFDYSPFFEALKRKGISQHQLIVTYGVSAMAVHRMVKKKNMTFSTAAQLMKIAGIDDIHDFVIIRLEEKKADTGAAEDQE